MDFKKKLKFLTYFPHLRNIHLIKSVGMIPYVLKRDFNCNSYILTFENGEYPYLSSEVKGLKLIFLQRKFFMKIRFFLAKINIPKKFINFIEPFCHILDNFVLITRILKNVNILELFHLKIKHVLIGLIFRIVNPQGVLYIKLDMDRKKIKDEEKKPRFLRWQLLNQFMRTNILSCEETSLTNYVKRNYSQKRKNKNIIYGISNGFDFKNNLPTIRKFGEKDNIILHVGSIGIYQKASEIIIKAFLRIAEEFPDWKLILIGSIKKEFLPFIDANIKKSKFYNSQVFIQGFLESREKLFDFYNKAKILAIPSRFESFGFVTLEAESFGNVIIGSDIFATRALTNDGKLAYLCPIDDISCFVKKLRFMLTHQEELEIKSKMILDFVRKNFDWTVICKKLLNIIKMKIEENKSK